MGDFPRWIDREDVDSYAMYSAFLKYRMETEQLFPKEPSALWRPEWWGHIYMILHRIDHDPSSTVVCANPGIRHLDCQRSPCRRCDEGMGGYQFRWYSQYWAKHYNEMRRPGAWRAPEPVPPTRRNESLRFWEKSETS